MKQKTADGRQRMTPHVDPAQGARRKGGKIKVCAIISSRLCALSRDDVLSDRTQSVSFSGSRHNQPHQRKKERAFLCNNTTTALFRIISVGAIYFAEQKQDGSYIAIFHLHWKTFCFEKW
jgi:hypothetical protein